MADSSEPAFLFLYRKGAVAPVDYLSTGATAPRSRTSQGYRNLSTVESIADLVVLVRQKENLGSLFRIAIVIEIQKIVGAFSPNSGIIVEKCFINF